MQGQVDSNVLDEQAILPEAIDPESFAEWTSPAMRLIESVVGDIAPTDIPVLLTGERGTGKEVVALQIHRRSRRRDCPFIKLQCGSLTPEGFDRVLPPNGRGAESTQAATVMLDEISELSPTCQAKIFQTLAWGNGFSNGARPGLCVISITRQNLEEEVRLGRFWDELYSRISGVCLRLPPLRHRKEDTPVLVEFFLSKYAALFERPRPSFSARTLRALLDYTWPGNVRELEGVVKQMVASGDENAVLPGRRFAAGGVPEGHSLKEASRAASRQAEREMILKVLTQTRWNRKRAAQELKISYKALLYKLKQIGLDDAVARQATSEP